jgi:DNA-binding response OmpR family regulator
VHVASLRRKLGDPGWIETVRGVGFRLRMPE